MYKHQIQEAKPIIFKQYGRKGYSIFNSLSREVRIGVLTVATLATATLQKVEAAQPETTPQIAVEDEDGKSLGELTVNGALAPLTQLQSARIVSVLTRRDIEQAGVQSINDLMKLATGVDVRQRGGFGIQTDISIDGGTYEQVTILLNGVNISNPHTGHLAADFPVSLSDIERIEVLEGAASRVYGGQAFGGAINIVTLREGQSNLSAGLEGGSHGTVQGDARVAWVMASDKAKSKNHDAFYSPYTLAHRLSGGGGRSDGGTINDAWTKGQLYYQGDFSNKEFDLDWQFGFSRKSYGANTFYSGMSNDQWEQNERYLISVSGETKGRFHFKPQVYWNRTYDNYQWHKGTPNNSHQADVYGTKIGGWFNWVAGRTAVSAELRNEGILSSALGKPMDEADYMWAHGAEKQYTKQANRTNISFNLEHNVLLERWTLSAGLMANSNSSVGHRFEFYPGIDLAYRPADNWKLFASYNKGFRLPSFTDLYYNSPDITGNSQLKPEENQSLSVGAKFDIQGLHLTVRGFFNHGHNMIDYVKAVYGDAAHADNFNLDNLGFQTELKLDFNSLLRKKTFLNNLSLGYTFMNQDREGKYQIFTSLYADDYLKHKLTASLNHRIVSRLYATWSLRYQKRMGSYQVYSGLTPTDQLENYKPYTTLDLKLQWTDKHYDIYVQGTNLTNNHYCDLGNIPQPGIWVMAGARWKMNF